MAGFVFLHGGRRRLDCSKSLFSRKRSPERAQAGFVAAAVLCPSDLARCAVLLQVVDVASLPLDPVHDHEHHPEHDLVAAVVHCVIQAVLAHGPHGK